MAKPPKITTGQMYRKFCEGEEPSRGHTPMYDRVRSCISKRKTHLTLDDAQRFATNASRMTKENYVGYKCRWCFGFHVGHAKED